MQCHEYRIAQACTDTVKKLQHIRDFERGLVQTWRYFSISEQKTTKLHEMQATNVDSSERKLLKACLTRWLYHGEAVIAVKIELSIVYAAINYFSSAPDCIAVGVLYLI